MTRLKQLEDILVKSPDRVMIIAGTGVSLASCENECASWKGLLNHGLTWCQQHCDTAASRVNIQRESLSNPQATPEDFIAVAEFITTELKKKRVGIFNSWLSESIGSIRLNDRKQVLALAKFRAKIATTNYDNLIEEGTGYTPITWRDETNISTFLRESTRTVFHIHGHYSIPESVVLGNGSYWDVGNSDYGREALRSWMILGTFIFVGCGAGLEDPHFGSLLNWARATLQSCHHSHYMLVKSSDVNDWSSRVGSSLIDIIDYGESHGKLGCFLEKLLSVAE